MTLEDQKEEQEQDYVKAMIRIRIKDVENLAMTYSVHMSIEESFTRAGEFYARVDALRAESPLARRVELFPCPRLKDVG